MASSVEAEPWNRAWASESLCDLGLHSGLGLSPLPLRGCHYRGTYEALGGFQHGMCQDKPETQDEKAFKNYSCLRLDQKQKTSALNMKQVDLLLEICLEHWSLQSSSRQQFPFML